MEKSAAPICLSKIFCYRRAWATGCRKITWRISSPTWWSNWRPDARGKPRIDSFDRPMKSSRHARAVTFSEIGERGLAQKGWGRSFGNAGGIFLNEFWHQPPDLL